MKRTHAQFADTPYVLIGTPLPAHDPDSRDDGSYQPLWKQEVLDAQGRKRLHGAFTGGFSAGYFNTVGSKEGWTPSTFVSSRANRRKDVKTVEQKPEDFMDDEDLADQAEAEKISTVDGFEGLGSTHGEQASKDGFMGLFRPHGETMGVKLLKKMGWKEGQGIGPKVRRAVRSDLKSESQETHLFAPDNTHMVTFIRKTDHKGLGYDGETKLAKVATSLDPTRSDDEDDTSFGTTLVVKPKKKKVARSGIGIGILNDTGSDDEDPYEVGPRISYNKVIGGTKPKQKKKITSDTALKPVFISKKSATAKSLGALKKCHDGRLPLDGFVLASHSYESPHISINKYPHPVIPGGWTSTKIPSSTSSSATYISSTDAAKASKLNPDSRAAVLGEALLPGKSVFDFLTPAARDRLAAASGKTNLPAALSEVPAGYALTPQERLRETQSQIPKLDVAVAQAALQRSTTGFMPYSEDSAKQARYRTYLSINAHIQDGPPPRAPTMSQQDWLKELTEFYNCAQIFKPMSGMMANRFTSSSTTTHTSAPSSDTLISTKLTETAKIEDPAEQAARLGMFGHMTRSQADFYPTRLLCKRFGVQPPAHVIVDPGSKEENGGNATIDRNLELVGNKEVQEMMREHWDGTNKQRAKMSLDVDGGGTGDDGVVAGAEFKEVIEVEPDRNEALERERAGMETFKAIFGDSDEDDD